MISVRGTYVGTIGAADVPQLSQLWSVSHMGESCERDYEHLGRVVHHTPTRHAPLLDYTTPIPAMLTVLFIDHGFAR